MAFDGARARVVMFGGTTAAGDSSETWTWDGAAWANACTSGACTATVPPARHDAAMAFDSKRGVIVMVGGTDATGTRLNDTWEWDGTAWTARCTTAPCNTAVPHARTGHVLAYDARRERMVMFGGQDADGARADVWEWDGSAWTPVASIGPAARSASGAAYDSVRGRVILFGGRDTHGYPLGDTWEYHLRGSRCTDNTTCDSGNCVDGVCCDVATCGTCEACNIGDTAGECVQVTNMADPDTCAGDRTCSASGTCGLTAGQPCSSDGECAGARCGADPCNRVCL
jgi:hypothetical protein